MAAKDIHVIILKIVNVTFADVLTLSILRLGDYPGLSELIQYDHMPLLSRQRGG